MKPDIDPRQAVDLDGLMRLAAADRDAARQATEAEALEEVKAWHMAMQRAFKGLYHPRLRQHYLKKAGGRL